MTASGDPGAFVPLPMAGSDRPNPGTGPAERTLWVVYVKYRDPAPLEFPGIAGIMPGPVFHAAGVMLREDEEYLALGELALAEENRPYITRFGADMFPAYRHVLTIPKAAILERRTFQLSGKVGPPGGSLTEASDPR